MQDRPYQEQAENSVVAEYDKGTRRMLLSMATGTGKTIVMSRLYEKLRSRLPGQMIVLAHTEELVKQNRDKMQLVNPGLKVDMDMAEHRADPATADIISASVATLGRKGTSRVNEYNWQRVDKIFVDEAHHSTTDSYKNVLHYGGFLSDDHTNKLLVGVTATPQRSDGKALAELYEKVAFVYSIRQAIEEGYLVDVRGFSVTTDTSLDGVGRASGDFKRDELEDAVNNPRRNNLVVKSWQNLAGKRQSVVFCVGIQHARELARVFEESGVVAAAVWGDDPARAEKLRLHREGKIQVLCNCSVLVEGYDDPSISCIVLSRPTQSAVLFTQMVGRGTRLHPNKSDLIVLDVVDASSRHSLITLPTLMGLPGILDIKGRSLLSVVREIENELEKRPSADLSKLKSIDDLKATIASINMFDVRFPAEVEANSELTWFRAADGGYAMRVPKEDGGKTGRVDIRQNMLDQWELWGKINGQQFHGVRSSMEDAFKVADEQIRKRVKHKMTLSAIRREATWHKNKASKEQKVLLKRLFPWQTFPEDLTRGQASRILGERLAGKAK